MLEAASTDNLDFLKDKALKAAAALLGAKPEGEARLLALLVNKLGDPSRRLASKVGLYWRRAPKADLASLGRQCAAVDGQRRPNWDQRTLLPMRGRQRLLASSHWHRFSLDLR
jgi:hypothetical protein